VILAHAAHGAAAHGEFAVLGFALALVGLVLMFQKTAKQPVPLVLLVVGVIIIIGALTF
jgi:hypothetical protein